MAQAANAFSPDEVFVVRRPLTTDREYAPGEVFDNASVDPRRLRTLFETRRIIRRDRESSKIQAQGPLVPWMKGEKQEGRKARETDMPRAPRTDARRVPVETADVDVSGIDAALALAAGKSISEFHHFRAEATKILGAETPSTKIEMIEALQAERARRLGHPEASGGQPT